MSKKFVTCPDAGVWLEQSLFQTLQTWRAGPAPRKLDFWLDRPGHEVDFILEQDGELVALEIKTSSTGTSSDAAGLRAFRDSLKKNHHLARGIVLRARQGRPLDNDVTVLPWGWMVATG